MGLKNWRKSFIRSVFNEPTLRRKILIVSLGLAGHLVRRGPRLAEYRQRSDTRPDFAASSDGPSDGRRLRRRSAGIRALFGSAAASASGFSGRRGTGAAGTAFQSLLRNPLADPYVLGVSTGASMGTILYSLFAGWIGFAAIGSQRRIWASAWPLSWAPCSQWEQYMSLREDRSRSGESSQGCCLQASSWPPFFPPSTSFCLQAPTRRTCAEFSTGSSAISAGRSMLRFIR